MNPNVDTYLEDGCGRCKFYKTPQCKVHTWAKELKLLRMFALDCGLHEEYKWSQPCYTFNHNNILLVTAFKEYAAVAFFKGALLQDKNKILITPGKSSQSSKQLRLTNVKEIMEMEHTIKAFIYEAIEVEKAGLKVNFKKNPEPIPDELQQKLDEDSVFKTAFEALTAGKQRGYIIHFSQPKQAKTRLSRIEKCKSQILNGFGFHDAYRMRNK